MDPAETLFAHAAALYPICRSITGNGLRQTLRYVASHIPAELREVPSGTPVLDWQVPLEWNVNSATLETAEGETIVDFARHNLHLLQYSHPVDRIVPLEELQSHLHSLPDQPDLIPYRTAYYADTWGFCLPHRERLRLAEPAYRVRIDTTLSHGSLTYAECFLPGTGPTRSFCGSIAAIPRSPTTIFRESLSRSSSRRARRPAAKVWYRFLFIPGTIGAITWLHFNRDAPQRVRHGLVLTCLGDAAPPTYKQSRRGNAPIDRYVAQVLGDRSIRTGLCPSSLTVTTNGSTARRLQPAGRLPDALAARRRFRNITPRPTTWTS